MKKVLFYLLLFICSFSTATFAQSYRRVSEKEALYIAQKQFTGKDVDYYIHKDMNSAVWIIFVDAEPMKGWEHDCFILGIPKSTCGSIDEIVPNIKRMSMPPNDKFTPLLVKNRYGNNVNLKPQVKKSNSTNEVPEVAQRTYAIIISGGGN
ncbi:PepSY domain-containing protein, partial [Prevotella pectinovora]|uniref:PepSY domain-containing protein n=2 Tax=Prevotella TaxID=838 RepID=UPI003080BB4B